MIAALPCHAEILAAIHAAAFSGEEVWDARAFAVQLALPGVFGAMAASTSCPPPPPGPLPPGEGEKNARPARYSSPPLAGGAGGGGGQAGLILARVAADQAEILTLAVIHPARRRGVGGALLRAAMDIAAGRGAATLFLEVSAANAAARALYAGAGFQQVGRRDRYYPDGADALVLARPLSVAAAATG